MIADDKRKHRRFNSIHLSYICLDHSEEVVHQAMARTINISELGFLLETHFKMKIGYTLIASIGIRDETVDVKGEVIHIQPSDTGKHVAGIKINEIEGGDRERWNNFIQKILAGELDSSSEK